jgi:hypothetical protein
VVTETPWPKSQNGWVSDTSRPRLWPSKGMGPMSLSGSDGHCPPKSRVYHVYFVACRKSSLERPRMTGIHNPQSRVILPLKGRVTMSEDSS